MPAPFDLFSPFKYFNIAPVTDWERFINPQFNFTVNHGDAAIENHVLANAGSYGKQIGRMQEVLDVLIARLPLDQLTAVQARSVERYQENREKVVTAVRAAKSPDEKTVGKADVEEWLDRLAQLRDSDPEQFDRLAKRIAQFLSGAGPAGSATQSRGR